MAGSAQRFLGRYLFSAVLGTTLIVFGAPFIRLPASVEPIVRRAGDWMASQPAVEKASLFLHRTLSWRLPEVPTPPAPPAKPPPTPPAVVKQPAPPAETQTVAVAALPPIELEPPPEEPAQTPKQVAEAAPDQAPQEAKPEPKAPEARPQPAKPKGKWAVVTAPDTKVYSTKGKFITRVDAGALLAIRDIIDTESGTFARGSVQSATNRFEDALVPGEALEVYEGELSQITARQKELLSLRARIEAELRARKAGTGQYLRNDNPHMAEYSRIRKQYVEYLQKVKQLQADRDSSSGGRRIDTADELRSMQGKGVTLSREYEAISKQYTDWNKSHPNLQGEQRTAVDILERRLTEIKAQLEANQQT